MHVYLIVQTHIVLSEDKYGDENDKKEASVSVHFVIGGIEYEEEKVTKVVEGVQILDSSVEEVKKNKYLNVP